MPPIFPFPILVPNAPRNACSGVSAAVLTAPNSSFLGNKSNCHALKKQRTCTNEVAKETSNPVTIIIIISGQPQRELPKESNRLFKFIYVPLFANLKRFS